jgi:hypothetical protein
MSRKQKSLWNVPPEKVELRGVAVIPASRMNKKATKELTANPKRSRTAPGKKEKFPAFKIVGDRALVPRYTYGSDLGIRLGIADKNDTIVNSSPPLMKERKFDAFIGALRDEQKPGVNAALRALQRWNGVTIKGKCGSGKTVVGTYLLWRIKSERSVVLVDQTKIAEQWTQTIMRHIPQAKITYIMPMADQRKICKKHGLDPAGRVKVDMDGDIVIAMAPTTHRNVTPESPIKTTLLIVDEAHKFSAPTFAASIFSFNYRYSVSLTATDERADGLSWIFKTHLGPVVVPLEGRRMDPVVLTMMAPLARKIDENDHKMGFCHSILKLITNYGCEVVNCGITDICNQREAGTKINYSEMWSRLTNDITYNMFLAQIIYAFWVTGRHALIFSKFRAHLEHLRDMLIKEVPEKDTSLFFGGMDKDVCLEPRLTFTTFKNSEHALDAVHKDACLLAMPITDVEQTTGRIERYKDMKMQPVIVDPLIQSVTTFRYQHEKHVKHFRKEGYEVIRCGSPDDALRWLHNRSQVHAT